jgi:hypothetical protein
MSALADTTADHLAMLLSTDWFLPHWPLIGIDAGSNDTALQQRCRSIVRDLIGGASDYYHISFNEKRLTATRTALVRAAVECSLRPAAATQIERICMLKSDRDEQHKTAWVLLDVVGPEMLQDQHLEPVLRTALNGAKQWFKFDAELLERQCIESRTDWDTYIRDLTPEQPSALFDFVAAGLIVEAQFAFVLNQLTTTQQNSLLAVCRKRRSQITGLPESDLW